MLKPSLQKIFSCVGLLQVPATSLALMAVFETTYNRPVGARIAERLSRPPSASVASLKYVAKVKAYKVITIDN